MLVLSQVSFFACFVFQYRANFVTGHIAVRSARKWINNLTTHCLLSVLTSHYYYYYYYYYYSASNSVRKHVDLFWKPVTSLIFIAIILQAALWT